MDKNTYLVIGGTSGIGAAIVDLLASQGAQVFFSGQKSTTNPNSFVWSSIQNDPIPVELIPQRLDGLVFCPGTINLKPFQRLTSADFLQDWQVNFAAAVQWIQACLPALKQAKGTVLLFSTVAVQTGMPFHASISAAKGAIEGLVRSLAAEFAPVIRLNAIAPSLTETKLASALLANDAKKEASAKRHPLGRYGRTDDVAKMAAFLLDPANNWITGQIFAIDGGMSSLKLLN